MARTDRNDRNIIQIRGREQNPGNDGGYPGMNNANPGAFGGYPGANSVNPGMNGVNPGMNGGNPGVYAQGRPRRTAPEGGEPTIPDGSPVRTAEEEAAYRMGQRMGTETMLREQGMGGMGGQGMGGQGMGGMGSQGMGAQGMGLTPAEGPITKEHLLRADRKLMEYKAGKASVERRIIHAQQWWKMRNWQEQEAERGTKGATEHKSATGWLWNCIVGKHADAIDCYPEPVILPRMQDDRDEARKLSEIIPVVLQMNEFENVYNLAQWQKMQEGTAGYGVFWDKTKMNGMGDISIRMVNILNLFWEPGVTDIQDSQNVFYVSYVDNDQLEGMYPQLRGKNKTKAMTVQKYRTDDNVDLTNKSPVVDWYYHKWDGPRKVLHYCKYVGEEILYSTENNGETDGLYNDGNYPFVLDPLFPVAGSPCGYGYIDIGKDAQMDIDTLNHAMVLNAVASAIPRHFIRKDGGVNEEEFADWTKPLVHVNGNLGQDSILPIQTVSMSGTAMTMLQQKIDELKFVTGNNDVNNGGTPAGVTAASAIAALKEDAGRSSKDSTKAAYRAYGKIIHMVIERIRQFYDIPRQFRILGEYNQEEFTSYSNAGIRPQPVAGGLGMEEGYRMPVFDIDVRAQRENAYTKMSQNELALQFYNAGMFNPQMSDQALVCLDMMEFKGKDELTQKVRQNGTLQDTLMQVSQIALALAQQYQPEVAEQLAGVIQGVVQDQAIAGGRAGAIRTGQQSPAGKVTDSQDKGSEANENTIVRKARERAANASRPS